ncbi:MAG: hypothetical protein IT233_04515 [Bacteroidia bacterium]|nr:hypothetical protein [Bacteroidia bacterium]
MNFVVEIEHEVGMGGLQIGSLYYFKEGHQVKVPGLYSHKSITNTNGSSAAFIYIEPHNVYRLAILDFRLAEVKIYVLDDFFTDFLSYEEDTILGLTRAYDENLKDVSKKRLINIKSAQPILTITI